MKPSPMGRCRPGVTFMTGADMKRLSGIVILLIGLALPALAGPEDDTVTLGLVLKPPHLDPTAGAAAVIDEVTHLNVFEGLTAPDPVGRIRPLLARSWTVSADGLTWTFDLRRDVRFHDGRPFDAEIAKFSLDRARAPGSANAQRPRFAAIERVEVVDSHRLRVHLSSPIDLPRLLAWGDAVMVHPDSADSNRTAPVGTGPFRFVSWRPGAGIDLARWPDYWGPAPALDGARFRFLAEPGAATRALLDGAVDAFPNFMDPEALVMFERDPEFNVEIGTTEGETLLAINHDRPPLDDVRVRRALAHAVDRDELIRRATLGFGTPIGSHFPPYHPAHVDLTGHTPHDPAKARALLRAAGAEDLSLTLAVPPAGYARRSAEVIAEQLARVGIAVDLQPVDWRQWLDQVFKRRDYDLSVVAHTEPMDIDIYARGDYYFNYHSPEFRHLIARLNHAVDPEVRRDLLVEAQRHLAEDQVNVFLFQLARLGVWRRGLAGLWPNAPMPVNDLSAVRWEE